MVNTMQRVLIPGTPTSGIGMAGIDVSVDPRGWQRKRPCSAALAFPTVNRTGVSAGGRRT